MRFSGVKQRTIRKKAMATFPVSWRNRSFTLAPAFTWFEDSAIFRATNASWSPPSCSESASVAASNWSSDTVKEKLSSTSSFSVLFFSVSSKVPPVYSWNSSSETVKEKSAYSTLVVTRLPEVRLASETCRTEVPASCSNCFNSFYGVVYGF